jgi:RNA polymerase sigma factor (sigma-70 family)
MANPASHDPARKQFEDVAMMHLDAAFNLARWLTGNNHDAEDATQEAFLRAYTFFHTFRGDDARAWLLAIVRNTCHLQWRQRGRHGTVAFDEERHSTDDGAPEAASWDPYAVAARNEALGLVDRALSALPLEFREAVLLREAEDLSYRQIAEALDVPIGTVMSRIARGRQMMLRNFRVLVDDGAPASIQGRPLQAAVLE